MKYSPEVQEQLDRLVKWSQLLGIHLVTSNQGYSVKVLNLANPMRSRGVRLSDLVSLYNQGPYLYLVNKGSITPAQARCCKMATESHYSSGKAKVPITLQRIGAYLKSADIISPAETAHLNAQIGARKEYLNGQ